MNCLPAFPLLNENIGFDKSETKGAENGRVHISFWFPGLERRFREAVCQIYSLSWLGHVTSYIFAITSRSRSTYLVNKVVFYHDGKFIATCFLCPCLPCVLFMYPSYKRIAFIQRTVHGVFIMLFVQSISGCQKSESSVCFWQTLFLGLNISISESDITH